MNALGDLEARLREVDDLSSAAALLRWDQRTLMPPGGAAARGRQTATLSRLAHEKLTDVAIGRLLDLLEREAASFSPDGNDAALVRLTRRVYEDAIRIPASLVSEWNEHNAKTYEAWAVARPKSDFAAVRPLLEKSVDLSRRKARCAARYESIADPLIAVYDYGLKASDVRAVFAPLRARLVPLVRAVTSREAPDDGCIRQRVTADALLAFAREIVTACGYDFDRGRFDLALHPFTTKFSLDDVRITTRVRENLFVDTLFTTLHEGGHAIYAQGIDGALDGTLLADPPSAGMDESQSRLWENLVGRSRPFWEHFYPKMQRRFPEQLGPVNLDSFYRAIHRVERSLNRGGADELTYNLHVMLRFDLEIDLLEGRLEVKDLADAWRERFFADFGIPVVEDRDGVLQDIHWYSAGIGGEFQGYTLGNIMSAQLFAAAVARHPEIPQRIGEGELGTLRGWLRDNVYRHGAKWTTPELLQRATGADLSIEPYLDYLTGKYGSLYGLDAVA